MAESNFWLFMNMYPDVMSILLQFIISKSGRTLQFVNYDVFFVDIVRTPILKA
jgi:hypothetical protein